MALRKIAFAVDIIDRRTGRTIRTDQATVYASDSHPDSDEQIARRAANEGRRGKFGQRLAGFRRVLVAPRPWERPVARPLEFEPMTFNPENEG